MATHTTSQRQAGRQTASAPHHTACTRGRPLSPSLVRSFVRSLTQTALNPLLYSPSPSYSRLRSSAAFLIRLSSPRHPSFFPPRPSTSGSFVCPFPLPPSPFPLCLLPSPLPLNYCNALHRTAPHRTALHACDEIRSFSASSLLTLAHRSAPHRSVSRQHSTARHDAAQHNTAQRRRQRDSHSHLRLHTTTHLRQHARACTRTHNDTREKSHAPTQLPTRHSEPTEHALEIKTKTNRTEQNITTSTRLTSPRLAYSPVHLHA